MGEATVVYRWDLDKTYLHTEFESFRGLARIPFEKAEHKTALPGVSTLIQALRRVSPDGRIRFLTASPPQLRSEIERKLRMDGTPYDSVTYKDQLGRLARGKFKHLREQVGYKVTELLRSRLLEPVDAQEYLFGDDWESDPMIYSLYADSVAGHLSPEDLGERLRRMDVDAALATEATRLARRLSPAPGVVRIFIHLARPSAPAQFKPFGPRLIPTFNYVQTAVCLFEEGLLDELALTDLAGTLIERWGYDGPRLENSIRDVCRRGCLGPIAEERALDVLSDHLGRRRQLVRRSWTALRWRLRRSDKPTETAVDYDEVTA